MNTAWLLPIIFSALTLGFYDICKKDAVKNNSVMPALFFATLSGSIFFVLATAASGNISGAVTCPLSHYLLTLLKSVIVGSSWVCVFYAMRELPITLASPLRATAPMWTMIGGLIIFHDRSDPVECSFKFFVVLLFIIEFNGEIMIFYKVFTIRSRDNFCFPFRDSQVVIHIHPRDKSQHSAN